MKKHILIVNQHGENRGDEAAMRAMLSAFATSLGDVEFTLIYQFRSRSLHLQFEQTVEALPMVLPPLEYLQLLIFTLLKLAGIELNSILSPTLKAIVRAYRKTDLVVSAPGGPYFGDIYVNHEIFHWWFILLGHLYRKPLFLYATSAGPFNIKPMNVVRRWLFRKFSRLVTREELSAAHIKKLLGKKTDVTITADSAIQQIPETFPRAQYFANRSTPSQEALLVAISLNDYKYPGSNVPDHHKAEYDANMIATLSYLAEKYSAYLMFFPQLYGGFHSDTPYLKKIANQLPASTRWEIVDQLADSNLQRRLFAMCDLHVASRYHPAIFCNITSVPGICIYYEHKALGFMQQLDLEKYAFDIWNLDRTKLCSALDEIIENRPHLIAHLKGRAPTLRDRALKTTELAVELMQRRA